MTGCICPTPGYCTQHQVYKGPAWHSLCQQHEAYFQAWEEGRGPGQKPGVVVQTCRRHATPPTQSMPSASAQVWDLAKSLAVFVSDGCKLVDSAEYQRRLEICEPCEFRQQRRCLKCGCNIAFKARGRAWTCKLGKWYIAQGEGDR